MLRIPGQSIVTYTIHTTIQVSSHRPVGHVQSLQGYIISIELNIIFIGIEGIHDWLSKLVYAWQQQKKLISFNN